MDEIRRGARDLRGPGRGPGRGAQAQAVAGRWHGTLDFRGGAAQVGVTLKAKPGGGYRGTLGRWIFPMTVIVPQGAAAAASLPSIPTTPLVLIAGKP